jgi:hypothetical protein
MIWIAVMAGALAVGVYVGLGSPGMPGRGDRIVRHGARRLRRQHSPLDWLRPPRVGR